jgi:hypothetical protein
MRPGVKLLTDGSLQNGDLKERQTRIFLNGLLFLSWGDRPQYLWIHNIKQPLTRGCFSTDEW